ncbi:MAG: insulinase family protein [Sphingobacteriales bacterium]|nr:MAG: insulinase family protein [Sphingobacteriales bacterium]
MTKERPVVDGEFQRAESDPGFQIWHESQKRLWGDLMTRKNPIGEHDVINTATPEKMLVIKDKYYHPNNSLLIIAGDVQPDAAFRLARGIWGDWAHSGFDPLQKYPIPAFKPLEKTDYFIKQSSIAQTPYMMFSWQGPSYATDSANTVIADVFSAALRLNASKWKQALVDKGLAPYADMGYSTCHYTGPISITVVPTPDKLEACYRAVMEQVSHFADADYFSEDLLRTAKEVIRRNEIRSKEKPSSLPMQLSYQWASTSMEYYTDYEANLMRVTLADLQNYARRYVVGKPYVAGLIINEEMAKASKPETFFKN